MCSGTAWEWEMWLLETSGQEKVHLTGSNLDFNWFGLQSRLNNENASMHPWPMTSTQQINKINQRWAIIGISSSHGFEPFLVLICFYFDHFSH